MANTRLNLSTRFLCFQIGASMEGVIEKSEIGTNNRSIEVGIHESERLLVICRHFTEEEMSQRQESFPYTAICLPKHNVEKLISIRDTLRAGLGEVSMGLPVDNRRADIGHDLYVTLDTPSHTAQVRRFWKKRSGGMGPTKSGVSMSPNEMMNLLAVLDEKYEKMKSM